MRVCAIVVTYNRKELLEKQIIEVMQKQKMQVDKYFIIDNCSTDETALIVKKYENCVLKYCKTEVNCGGAGGFSYGLQCAFSENFDWYILMDDDGRPYNENCFSNIRQQIERKNYDSEEAYLLNSIVMSDEQYLSFGLGHLQTLEEIEPFVVDNEIGGKINPFNGTWISNGLVKRIGFPNGAFFIKGDENDYTRRAKAVGAHVASIGDSIYYHPKVSGYEKKKVLGKEMYVYIEAPWKEYYSVRNHTYSYLQFGKYKEALFFCAKRVYCCLVCRCKKKEVLKMILKGYTDGRKGKLGATIRP